MASRRTKLLAIVGPGILVAATGVGAGDLATGALAGSKLGLTVLWAVLVAAGLKWLVTLALVATLALSVLVVWFAVHKAVSSPSLPSA